MSTLRNKIGSIKHNLNNISDAIGWMLSFLEVSFSGSLLHEKVAKLHSKIEVCREKADEAKKKVQDKETEIGDLKQKLAWLEEEQFSKSHLDPDPGIKNGWDMLINMAESDSYNRDDVEEFLRDRGVGEQAAEAILYLMHLIDYERFEGLEKEGKPLSDLSGMSKVMDQGKETGDT